MKEIILKFEKFLFYIFVFSIPFQTRIVISAFGASKDEFSSAFLYFTDILIALLFFSFLTRGFKIIVSRYDYFLLGFLLVALFSIYISESFGFGAYQAIKLLELSFLYFYIKSNKENINLNSVLNIFLLSGILQATIGIFQFFYQSDLGFKYLGETLLAPDMPGVAKIDTQDGKVMRPYGTFTHPNVLSAYLLFAIAFFYYLVARGSKKISAKDSAIFAILFFGFFLTFSRSAFLAMVFLSAVLFFKYRKNIQMRFYLVLSAVLFLLFSAIFSHELFARTAVAQDAANLNFRMTYENFAKKTISENPFLGVGPGNFVNSFKTTSIFPESMQWAYQPVHNTYLLITSETGIFGSLLLFSFFVFVLTRLNRAEYDRDLSVIFSGLFFAVSLLFFFDHYFWDLEQGRLMLWFLLGIIALNLKSES